MSEHRLKILRTLRADLDEDGYLGAMDPNVVEIFGVHYLDVQGATTGRYGRRMGPAFRLLDYMLPAGLHWRMDSDTEGNGEHRVMIYRITGEVRQVVAQDWRKDDLAGGILRSRLAALAWREIQPNA